MENIWIPIKKALESIADCFEAAGTMQVKSLESTVSVCQAFGKIHADKEATPCAK